MTLVTLDPDTNRVRQLAFHVNCTVLEYDVLVYTTHTSTTFEILLASGDVALCISFGNLRYGPLYGRLEEEWLPCVGSLEMRMSQLQIEPHLIKFQIDNGDDKQGPAARNKRPAAGIDMMDVDRVPGTVGYTVVIAW